MKLELISQKNLPDIYHFETKNKEFFQENLPPRPKGYFEYDKFEKLMNEIIEEQKRGECYMHIIIDSSGSMLGRVNLHSIDQKECGCAELGYRIGKDFQGMGYASEAVSKVLKLAFGEYNLSIIEAGTSVSNIASKRVLEKNNFEFIRTELKVMEINGDWVDGVVYRHRNKK